MTMSRFAVDVEIDGRPDPDAMALITRLTERLHGQARMSPHGLLEASLTLPAGDLTEAFAIAVAALQCAAGAPSTRVSIARHQTDVEPHADAAGGKGSTRRSDTVL